MRVTYVAAGAANMYCGSCLRDNALARELRGIGCDVTFVPFYTPITTDEKNASDDALLFGGVSVYLEQKSFLFRILPRFLTRWMDSPKFVKRVSEKRSIETEASHLGELTLSMLRGEHGRQKRQVAQAVDWIAEQAKPDLVNLTNLLIAGFVPALKRKLGVPVLATLQGDDLFLDELTGKHRPLVLAELRRIAKEIDGFVTFSEFYADSMAELLEVPREKFHLVPLGIDCADFNNITRTPERPPTVGYFGRIAPEKGFGQMVDAFIHLHKNLGQNKARLKAGGWLGEGDRSFYEAQLAELEKVGLDSHFDYVGSPERDGKLQFFKEIAVFSLPTLYQEPKGIPVLEALACGVPVVQPRHGAFPEMLAETGGGVLFEPGNLESLAESLADLLTDPDRCTKLGAEGRRSVTTQRTSRRMAEETLSVYEMFTRS